MLDADTRRTFEDHLAACSECREACDAARSMDEELARWSAEQTPPRVTPSGATRLQAMARDRLAGRGSRSRTRWLATAGAFAAAGALAVLAVWMLQRPVSGERASRDVPQVVVLRQDSAVTSRTLGDGARSFTVGGGGTLVARVDRDVVAVDEHSRLDVVPAHSQTARLRLHSGSVAVRAERRVAPQRLTVEAGGYSVTVIGTRFRVSLAAARRITVSVSEGKVAVVDLAGATHTVAAGQRLELGPNTPPQLGVLPEAEAASIDRAVATGPVDDATDDVVTARTSPEQPSAEPAIDTVRRRDRGGAAPEDGSLPTHADARQWILAGEYDRARAALDDQLSQRPKDARSLWLLGECERKAGRPAEAVAAYRGVAEHGRPPQANRARFQAAVLLQERLGKPRAAIALLRAYLAEDAATRPLDAAARQRLTRALKSVGE